MAIIGGVGGGFEVSIGACSTRILSTDSLIPSCLVAFKSALCSLLSLVLRVRNYRLVTWNRHCWFHHIVLSIFAHRDSWTFRGGWLLGGSHLIAGVWMGDPFR